MEHWIRHHIKLCVGREQTGHLPFSKSASSSNKASSEADAAKNTYSFFRFTLRVLQFLPCVEGLSPLIWAGKSAAQALNKHNGSVKFLSMC